MAPFSLKHVLQGFQETLPNNNAYEFADNQQQNSESGFGSPRASIHNLRDGGSWPALGSVSSSNSVPPDHDRMAASPGRTKLGMWNGVFFRCLNNIFGVIMFLRLGWIVAFAGVFYAIGVVLSATSITFITALSLSAICTNGKIAGGGAYYLISRALGPEFGGSIGILLYLATSTSVSLYLLGFAETLVSQLDDEIILESWDERIIALFALIFILLICIVGVSWVVKVEGAMLVLLFAAIIAFIAGAIRGPIQGTDPAVTSLTVMNLESSWNAQAQPANLDQVYTSGNKTRFCSETSSEAVHDDFGTVDFGVLLAVFFPAVCGIMAGANISGDLRDPSKAIPDGTILAIVTSTLTYIFLILLVAFCAHRSYIIGFEVIDPNAVEKSLSEKQSQTYSAVNQEDTIVEVLDCEYGGLFHDFMIMPEASIYPYIVYAGIYSATISSALGAFVGAPRILQSLARDRLFSVLTPFGQGYGSNDEPYRAYALTFFIALICILSGDLNSVAPLITVFFLASYALVNYACFALESSNSPGWRPSFRFFNEWIALAGAIACVACMLLLSAIMGFVTFALGLGLYKFVEVNSKGIAASMSNWGPARESEQYNAALKAALRLEAKEHVEQMLHEQPTPAQRDRPDATGGEGSGDASSSRQSANIPKDASSPPERVLQGEQMDSGTTRRGSRNYAAHLHPKLPDGPAGDVVHVKQFRPQCLVLAGAVEDRPALAVLATSLRKGRGVTLLGDVLVGDLSDRKLQAIRQRRAMRSYVSEFGIKAFNEVIISRSIREGFRSLIQVGGLGRAMRPNVVVLGFLESWLLQKRKSVELGAQHAVAQATGKSGTLAGYGEFKTPPQSEDAGPEEQLRRLAGLMERKPFSPLISLAEYVGIVEDAFDLRCGVIILRGEEKLLGKHHLKDAVEEAKRSVLLIGGTGPAEQSSPSSHQDDLMGPSFSGDESSGGFQDLLLHDDEGSPSTTTDLETGDMLSPRSDATALDSPTSFGEDGVTHKTSFAVLPKLNPISTFWDDITDQSSSSRKSMQQTTPKEVELGSMSRNEGKKASKWIDVWWVVDDGGLTIMIPHLMRKAKSPPFVGCKLRVMAVGGSKEEADEEKVQMKLLLRKLRIEATVQTCVLDIDVPEIHSVMSPSTNRASRATPDFLDSFEESEQDQLLQKGKARQDALDLRKAMYKELGKKIAHHSADATAVVVSLPVPVVDQRPDAFMEWLELLSANCKPPVVFVRGSQKEVLTVHG